ncbi:hypothetical protein BDV28DRAFT_131872 [Aspergillus coremiiformis]|uniref:Uncharacterized protein n=1 Tax=Aspergillus coremiiformis TaxID=138285 RepID=A0A5N6ZBH8_9EURO|nr:hypothetical protein BDV28DRAFT_131872 [Aspergillus coremiiformis]
MPIPMYNSDQAQTNPPTDTAGQKNHSSTPHSDSRVLETGSGDPVIAPGNSSTSTEQPLSKEEADRLYEERMEEEYAKREGGA